MMMHFGFKTRSLLSKAKGMCVALPASILRSDLILKLL